MKILPIYMKILSSQLSTRCYIAGTIGHVAHGKSTLVKAISGVQVNISSKSLKLHMLNIH